MNRQCHPANEWNHEHWTLNIPIIGNLYFECSQTIDSNSHNWKTRLNNNGKWKVWALSQTPPPLPASKIVHTLWLHGHWTSISTIRIRLKIVYHSSCFARHRIVFDSTIFSKLNCLRSVLLHCRVERQQIDENWWKWKWFEDAICGPLMEIAFENENCLMQAWKWCISYWNSVHIIIE